MPKNLNSSLRRKKKHRDPMKCYDQLPYELRQWLASALLPWSPRSALKAYEKALRTMGSSEGALAELDKKQTRLNTTNYLFRRDTLQQIPIWVN